MCACICASVITGVGSHPGNINMPPGCWLKSAGFWAAGKKRPFQNEDTSICVGQDPQAGCRVVRGGSFNNNQNNARCANRNRNNPDNRNNNSGFRLCLRTSFGRLYQKCGLAKWLIRRDEAWRDPFLAASAILRW
jgi:hypothetical protein